MIERTIIGTNTDNSNQAYTRRFINRGLLLISGAKLHQLLKTAKKIIVFLLIISKKRKFAEGFMPGGSLDDGRVLIIHLRTIT